MLTGSLGFTNMSCPTLCPLPCSPRYARSPAVTSTRQNCNINTAHLLPRLHQHQLPHRHLTGQHPASGAQVWAAIRPQLQKCCRLGHAVIQSSQVALRVRVGVNPADISPSGQLGGSSVMVMEEAADQWQAPVSGGNTGSAAAAAPAAHATPIDQLSYTPAPAQSAGAPPHVKIGTAPAGAHPAQMSQASM